MSIRFPLSLKITLWLLLNLMLLAAIGLGFFFAQAGLRWDSLVSGPAGERVQMLANVIAGELSATPPSAHATVLARFSTAYGVNLYLFSNSAEQLAGPALPLPVEVRDRLRLRRPAREAGPDDNNRPPPDDPQDLGPPQGDGLPPRGAPPPRQPFEHGRFLLRTGEPVQYWIGIRLVIGEGPEHPPTPVTLIAIATTLGATVRFLEWQSWLIAGAAVLGLSVLFWLPLVHSITRALGQLTAATELIAEGRFETRVDATRRDELGRLGHAVNQMAARLDTFVSGQKRFLGDVAHELCSPLARLQLAVGILEERDDPALKQAVADVREEVQQMSVLVNELLAFSKAGLRARDATLTFVEIEPLITRVVARENAGRIAVRAAPGLFARADTELLERALANLVRNALRYGGDGPIQLIADRAGAEAVLTLADEGPGVPPESLARLGEPFYRPEVARTRESGGIGLGLAIVKSSVEACRGQLVLRNRDPHGLLAEIRLAAVV